MSLLLDTHVVLWWLTDDRRLGAAARERIADPRDDIRVSAVAIWEAAIKWRIGRLDVAIPPERFVEALHAQNFGELAVTFTHAAQVGRLPLYHRDPFDRLMIVQAQIEGLSLVTADAAFAAYDVPVVDALT
ncbi:MAG: type II toxin-antitoxin system VapC family toxin [Alphaproteobacteria bacterium]